MWVWRMPFVMPVSSGDADEEKDEDAEADWRRLPWVRRWTLLVVPFSSSP